MADTDHGPQDGIGLCLSGGGYRAMLFHLGALWRLNELGYLPRLTRVASVSGGSITAALLGAQWGLLDWHNSVAADFVARVVEPIRRVASETLDVKSVLGGLFSSASANDKVVQAYDRLLYRGATLQQLPAEGAGPLFIILATNVQSGTLLRMSRPFMADYRVGMVDNPTVSLAQAVGASSAFPPVLSPAHISVPPGAMKATGGADLNHPPYTTKLVLTDGGVYDNLGLEPVWKNCKTVIVSDGGQQFDDDPSPHEDWARHALRINTLIDSQVRARRKIEIVGSLTSGAREGAYWRMRGDISKYPAPNTLPCPLARTMELAATPTRLAKMDARLQERIINWGYAICDAGMRYWVDKSLAAPTAFPYASVGV